jgi:hypothetical protein
VGIAAEQEKEPMSMDAISNGTISKRINRKVVTVGLIAMFILLCF